MSNLVLITRPIEDVTETALTVQSMGYKTFTEPLLNIKAHEVQIPDLEKYTGLIFTSRNAVRVFSTLSDERHLPVYVIGQNSADLAKKKGFSKVVMAGQTVQDMISHLPAGVYWHGRGRNITLSVKEVLAQNQAIKIDEDIIYHAKKSDKFSEKCLKHIHNQDFSHILFFSTRTAEAFVSLYKGLQDFEGKTTGLKQTKALCLSTSMIKCLSEIEWQDIAVADEPDRQSLLALL